MIVLDSTIIAVALPTIVADLHLTADVLIWIVNAYLLSYGGLLLLCGRLGDLYGRRNLFLLGISLFTLASFACGLAHTAVMLGVARAVQGLAGATVTAVSLSLITTLFPESLGTGERAKAMGVYGFVCAAGGSVGGVLGGFLTHTLGWHWIFFINIPIGIVVYILCSIFLARDRPSERQTPLDIGGAATITAALSLSVYTLANYDSMGWSAGQVGAALLVVLLLVSLFASIEIRVREPLIPLRLFKVRNFSIGSCVGVLWAAGSSAWFVVSALYLQRILGYDPFLVGVSFLPSSLIIAVFSVGLSGPVVTKLGVRRSIWLGLLLSTAGLTLFARAPVNATFLGDVLPGMVLMGLGSGVASAPLLLAAMNGVSPKDSGVASGIINTAFVMGAIIGLAALVSLANAYTTRLEQSGVGTVFALTGGYHLAFLVGAVLTAAAAAIVASMLPSNPTTTASEAPDSAGTLYAQASFTSRE